VQFHVWGLWFGLLGAQNTTSETPTPTSQTPYMYITKILNLYVVQGLVCQVRGERKGLAVGVGGWVSCVGVWAVECGAWGMRCKISPQQVWQLLL